MIVAETPVFDEILMQSLPIMEKTGTAEGPY
jgi:hypothetical protein